VALRDPERGSVAPIQERACVPTGDEPQPSACWIISGETWIGCGFTNRDDRGRQNGAAEAVDIVVVIVVAGGAQYEEIPAGAFSTSIGRLRRDRSRHHPRSRTRVWSSTAAS